VTAIEPGADMAALARGRLATHGNVKVETSTVEKWDNHGRRFHVIVAASAWHWVDPSIGWRRAHDVLYPAGWVALLGNVHRGRLEAVRRLPDLAGAVHALVDSLDLEGDPCGGAGRGRELSAHGIREFCNIKTVWIGLSRVLTAAGVGGGMGQSPRDRRSVRP
jgi:hypothetical protein